MTDAVISLNNVSKIYKLYGGPKDRLKEALHPLKKTYHKPFYALKDLSLQIQNGDVLGVVGRNGSGKSTLLKLITGVLQPDRGKIAINGKVTALLELSAGFNPESTGIENIHFYALVTGLTHKQIDEKLDEIINFAELGDFLYQPVKTYSSGMKTRLGFALAVHVDPEILLLDEVLAVGDALFRRKCHAKMEEFFKAGKTIVYVSHDTNSVNRLCSRAVLIHQGGILMDGEPNEVTKCYEKMLFTKQDNLRQVVAEISESAKSKKEYIEANRHTEHLAAAIETKEQSAAYFIPNLIPKSTIRIEDKGVTIFDPRIETVSGKRVNVVNMHERYAYVFAARFSDSYEQVSFGSQIKAIDGYVLSGASLQNAKNNIRHIDKGVYQFTYEFISNLLPGDYYIDSSISDQNTAVLARIKDIIMFRVMAKKNIQFHGKVTLGQELKYEFFGEI